VARWDIFSRGPNAPSKQILLPISALIPMYRPVESCGDQRFRSRDRVYLDWARLRLNLFQISTLRIMVFVFENTARNEASGIDPPYQLITPPKNPTSLVPEVPCSLNYFPLSTNDLMGIPSSSTRQLSDTAGPFACKRNFNGHFVLKASDGETWTAAIRQTDGKPFGRMKLGIDGGRQVDVGGSVCKFVLPVTADLSQPRYRCLDFFVSLKRWKEFKQPYSQLASDHRPLEMFVFVDAPGFGQVQEGERIDPVGSVTSMDLELSYKY
jgi:hypothetical protein